MQLRRAVPLSLLALLASAGCVSVGPQAPAPVRGSVPPLGAPETTAYPPASPSLPLGKLPGPTADTGTAADPSTDPSPGRSAAKRARPPAERPAKAAPPRRVRPPKPPAPRPHRQPAPPPRMEELCAAAEGVVPEPVVDLCLRQYGR